MGSYRRDDRTISATARLGVLLTPTANSRLAALAALHSLTRAAMLRSAVESWVHASRAERRGIVPAGPPPPPERASVPVTVAVTPETVTALETLAVETKATKTKVIRSALNAVAAECGEPPLFAMRAQGQRWPKADAERRPRGPKVQGFASRTSVGMARPRWTFPAKD